jgi:pyroglutamyl-peptidase
MQEFPKNPGHDESGRYSENDNTSHLITQLLPSQLRPFSKDNPTAMDIRILNPTSAPGCAVKTEYGFVRKYCEELWKSYGNSVDLVLHLGMADGWTWYSIERSAWKEGTVKGVDNGNGIEGEPLKYYILPDNIDQTSKDIAPCPWTERVPDQLWAGPSLDIDQVAKDVEQNLNANVTESDKQYIEVRSHPDAGNYLCGFISYESFAQAFVNKFSAKSIFCHVPSWKDEKRLEIGRDFVCSLIGQIAKEYV